MNIGSICENGDILSVIRIVNILITIIKIIIPIILMVTLMIDYTRAVYKNDSEALVRTNKTAIGKVLAAMLIFFIPTFVNVIADISSYDTKGINACIANATPEKIEAAYVSFAQKIVDIAKEEVTEPTYLQATQEVSKLKESEDKSRLQKELEEIKKALEEKKKKQQEEWESHQKIERGWMFPAGSTTTTTIGGKLFATDAPAGTRLTAYFGGNDSVHQGLGGGHGAIDIGLGRGTYVIATRSGTVVSPTASDRIDYPDSYIKPDENGKYNCAGLKANYVKIDHGDGTMSGYAHFLANTITVRAGDHVDQGQVIGQVGSSGCSTGPHLHFEVYVNGTRVDPLDYVSVTNPRP